MHIAILIISDIQKQKVNGMIFYIHNKLIHLTIAQLLPDCFENSYFVICISKRQKCCTDPLYSVLLTSTELTALTFLHTDKINEDHCRGVYLPLSIKGDEIPFLRYSHFSFFSQNPRWSPKVVKIEIFPLA